MRACHIGCLTGLFLYVLLPDGTAAQGPGSLEASAQPLTGPIHISASTRIAPGTYRVGVPAGKAVIEIDTDHVTLDLTGVTLESGIERPWEREGVGVHSNGHSYLTIRGGAIHGYRFGIFLQGGEDLKVIGSDDPNGVASY